MQKPPPIPDSESAGISLYLILFAFHVGGVEDLMGTVVFETMTLTVSTDRPVVFSASLFTDAEAAQAATDTVFGWAEWFEFVPAQ